MKRFYVKTNYLIVFIFLITAFLAACGSSTHNPAYDGNTSKATVTENNSDEIATKAIGFGLLSDYDGSGNEALVAVKSSLASNDSTLSKSVTKSGGSVLDELRNIVFYRALYDVPTYYPDFPNISGSFEVSYVSDDDKTFIVTYRFENAKNITGSHNEPTITTITGTRVDTVTFDYDDSFDLQGHTDEAKFHCLLFSENQRRYNTVCTGYDVHVKSMEDPSDNAVYDDNQFGEGYGGYDQYYDIDETSYILDGTFEETMDYTDTMTDEGFGEESQTCSTTFTGSIDFTNTYSEEDNSYGTSLTLSLNDGLIEINDSYHWSKSAEGDNTIIRSNSEAYKGKGMLPSYGYLIYGMAGLPQGDAEIIIQGEFSFTSTNEEDGEGTTEITVSVDNGSSNILSLEKTSEFTTTLDQNDDFISYDSNDQTVLSLACNARISYAYTSDESEEPDVLELALNSGKVSFNASSVYTEDSSDNESDTTHYAASLSGTLKAEYLEDTLTLSGKVSADYVYDYIWTVDSGTTSDSESLVLTIDNLRLTGSGVNIALHGSAEYTYDQLNSPETQGIDLDMIVHSGDKTYHYEDYSITWPGESEIKAAVSNDGISISGTFYHHDYGYVNVSTTTPFVFENGSYPPTSGTLSIEGSDGSTATLEAFVNDDEEPVYSVTMGETSIVSEGEWPSFSAALLSLPIISDLGI